MLSHLLCYVSGNKLCTWKKNCSFWPLYIIPFIHPLFHWWTFEMFPFFCCFEQKHLRNASMSISQCKIGEQVVEPRVWLKGELGSRRRWIKKRLDISKMTLSFDKLVLPGVLFHILSTQVYMWPAMSDYSPPQVARE